MFKRAALVAILCATLCGAFLIPNITSKADTTWCFSQDFTTGEYGWFVRDVGEGSYSSGVGWVMGGAGRVVIQRAMPSGANRADIEYTYTAGNGTKQALWRAGSSIEDIGSFWATMETSPNGSHSWHSEGGYFPVGRNYVELNIWASDDGTGSVTITRVVWRGTGTSDIGDNCSPTPTPGASPTPTQTSTPTPTSTPYGSGDPYAAGYCVAPNSGLANFSTLTGWSLAGGAAHPTGYTQYLELPPGSQAIYEVSGLSPSTKYSLYVKYRASSPASGDTFSITLGNAPPVVVSVENDTFAHAYRSPARTYVANFGSDAFALWSLKINKPASAPNTQLRIELLCIGVPTGGSPVVPITNPSPEPVSTGSCEVCEYKPVGDLLQDIPKFVRFLGCLWGSFWCQIGALLTGLWETILAILGFIGKFVEWLFNTIGGAIGWALNNALKVIQFIGGHLSNIIVGIVGFLSSILSAIGNVLGVIVSFVGQVIQVAALLVGLIFKFIGLLVTKVAEVIGLIPVVFNALVTGVNTSAAATPAWAPVCSDPSSFMYWPCVGLYVSDNTVFDGPAYWLIPGLMMVIGWGVLQWIVHEIQGALQQ